MRHFLPIRLLREHDEMPSDAFLTAIVFEDDLPYEEGHRCMDECIVKFRKLENSANRTQAR